MATPKGFYLVKNNRLALLSFGPYSGVGPCSGGPLLRGFTVHIERTYMSDFNCPRVGLWKYAQFSIFYEVIEHLAFQLGHIINLVWIAGTHVMDLVTHIEWT